MDGAGGRGVIFFFWSRGGMSKNLYDVRGWKKFAPLKKYPLSPQPDTEVYIMKGEIFNKGFCYQQDDIKSQIILKKNQFLLLNSLLSEQLKGIKVTFNLTNLSS